MRQLQASPYFFGVDLVETSRSSRPRRARQHRGGRRSSRASSSRRRSTTSAAAGNRPSRRPAKQAGKPADGPDRQAGAARHERALRPDHGYAGPAARPAAGRRRVPPLLPATPTCSTGRATPRSTRSRRTSIDAEQDRDRKAALVANLPQAKQEVADLNAALKQAIAQLPDTKEIPDLLSGISAVARESGLEIQQFRQKPEIYQDFYAEVPVEILVQGTYWQVESVLQARRRPHPHRQRQRHRHQGADADRERSRQAADLVRRDHLPLPRRGGARAHRQGAREEAKEGKK